MGNNGGLTGKQDIEAIEPFWKGTRATFDRLANSGMIKENRVYFIGKSDEDTAGFANSEVGEIAVGKAGGKYVLFAGGGGKGEKGDKGDKGDPGETPDLSPIYQSLDEKTSKTEGIAWYRSAYNKDHAEDDDYQKILTFNLGSFIVLNVTNSVFGSPSQNTLWMSAQNEAFICSVFDWGFVCKIDKTAQKCSLYLPTLKYTTPAVGTYTFQVVQQFDEVEDVEWFNQESVFEKVDKPIKSRVVYIPAPPSKETSISFDVANNTANVSLADATDYIGNVDEASNMAVIFVEDEHDARMYRFTFTKTLEGGVQIKNTSNVTYCAVTTQITKGDVITFTSVENKHDGWAWNIQGASIKSSDGSVNIEWNNGIADLSVPGGGFDPSTLARVATTGSSEDLVDKYYTYSYQATEIEERSGYPNNTNGKMGTLSILKKITLITDNYLESWIKLYTPFILGRAKEKKVYYVPKQTTWNIPSDAEIVILRRDDFPDDTDEMTQDYIDLYLPDGIQIGRQIHIIATNYSSFYQKPLTLRVKAVRGKNSEAGYYLRYLYQGNNIIFTYYEGNQDDYDGGWSNK